MTQRELAFCLEDLGQHNFAQGLELRLVPEEASLANGDLVEQAHEFGLADGLDGEAIVVIAKGRDADFFHAPLAAILQEPELVIRLKNARDLVDEIANFYQVSVGRSVKRHRRGGAQSGSGHA